MCNGFASHPKHHRKEVLKKYFDFLTKMSKDDWPHLHFHKFLSAGRQLLTRGLAFDTRCLFEI